jgi:hypothetical protein
MPPGPAPRNQWLGRWYSFAIQTWGGQVLVFDNWWPSFKSTANTTIREPLLTVLSRRFGQYQWDLARISGFRNKAVCGLLEEQILSWLLLNVPATSGLVDCRPCNRLRVGLRGFFGHRWELAVPLNLAGDVMVFAGHTLSFRFGQLPFGNKTRSIGRSCRSLAR